MSKYGEGLGKEIIKGVNKRELDEPLTTAKIKSFCSKKGWNPPDNYLNAFLANASSEKHSLTYVKCIVKNGNGEYFIAQEFREQ